MANKTHGNETETDNEPSMAQVLARMAEIMASNQEVQKAQLKQTARKSNDSVPLTSPFNRRGDKDFPVAPLKCEIYAPWKMTPELHSLTREEVELFNLLEPGVYKLDLTDGSEVICNVVGVRNANTGDVEKMSLMGAKDEDGRYGSLFNNENKQQFPSLILMLRQMIGDPADAVMSTKKEIALIKAGELAVSVGA